MFKLNLKIAWRALWKNKGYTFINVLGLSIGMASCILIFIFIRYQMSFDEGFKNEDRTYRLTTNWTTADGFEESQGVPKPTPAAFRNDFKNQVEKVGAIRQDGGIIKVKDDAGKERIKILEDVFYAEPAFFHLMSFEWLQGNPVQSLTEPNTVVLSKAMATKLFGDWNKAGGKTINYQNRENFTITGILQEMPENSSFPLNIVVSYQTFKNYKGEGVSIDEIRSALPKFSKKYFENDVTAKEEISVQALSDIHYNENLGNFANKTMPKKELYGLAVIGAFLLLMACINFINLATAQAVTRSKEVGVRKVMGSLRKQLVIQFLTETLTISVFALLFACVLTEVTLPGMKSLFHENISFSIISHPIILVFLIGLVLLVSFLAGFYPALIMSRLSPALAIKNKVIANAGGIGLRKTLVVVQFAITAILITSTLVVIKQMSYIRNKSLGFDTNALALINLPTDSLSKIKFNTFKDRILKTKGVNQVSFCNEAPSSRNNNETNFSYNGSKDADFQVNIKMVDEDYAKTFGIKFIAGKMLPKSDTTKAYIVNETLLKKLNVTNPEVAIGKIMNVSGVKAPICGVIKDFNNASLREAISPVALFSSKNHYRRLAIKLESKEMLETLKSIENTFNNTFPDDVYKVNFIDDQISAYYRTERVMGTLFKVFACVVIFISFIGLFGLISFVSTQRTKEIAIRKVLGATNMELIKMLNSSFLWMVLIANLVACPIAYILIKQWLSGFEYRIDLSIWPFLIAMSSSLVITLITVSIRSFKAANANTIDALKYE